MSLSLALSLSLFLSLTRAADGSRHSLQLVKAKDWLAGHSGSRGPEVNPLIPSEKQVMPPALPMYLSRDHLHDRNRETALYDPAQPGLETYVRVTRRRAPPETEAFLQEEARQRMEKWKQEEAIQTSEAFELLELRSMGVRSALVAADLANQRVAAGEWQPGPPSPPTAQDMRAAQLHKKLGIDKVQLVTSPLHIDDTPGGYWSADGSPDPNLATAAPAPTPSPAGGKVAMRGGAWPATDTYFAQPVSPPKKKGKEELHNKGVYASSAARAATRASA